MRQVVERFQRDVRYWEPRNEPNFGASGAAFVTNELMDFHATVKSVDPNLEVMGPGTVSIGPQLQGWLDDFFQAGGGRYIDVFSLHIYGKTFERALDFGKDGNKLYLGSLFAGGNKTVAAFMNAGCGLGQVGLRVKGTKTLRWVFPFGVVSELAVVAGTATVPVPEIPVYVELDAGQQLEVVPQDWGQNLARLSGVTAAASGTGAHPVDKNIPNEIEKIHNGEYENWYWAQKPAAQEWMDDTKGFPAWVQIRLPSAMPVARVVVFCGVPWQWRGTFVDHELQYDQDGQWITLQRIQEPTQTFGFYSPPTRTTVDSFFSDRWIF